MAEVIGLAAGITAIAGTATTLSLGFADLVSRLGKARETAQSIANDLSLLSLTLNELAEALHKTEELQGSQRWRLLSAVFVAIDNAKRVIRDVKSVYETLSVKADLDATIGDNAADTLESTSTQREKGKGIPAKQISIAMSRIKLVFKE